mmetsp:Transcript_60852/g.149008  ORF Transcript_60852/g.149008 Transcript_60852/m.149008 type:complete len:234 (-) Transcript_60852:391-1092(-)|eukprot:CAMPEP_0113468762 /NCGR_PEP_ID=MMETSP0014_2-20120614/15531_1 /TAXON_ID=2857 /ORGANISM="Nitzschia sp." /LENGTH=233 /DNA_ID=CAMNT_0000361179 /DNA_START=820 /DNA_END=1521 /DNA_ORIENTATION=- /assembly_acc=CAM_ASM_000159
MSPMSTSRSVACLAALSLLTVPSSAFSTSQSNNGPEVSRRQTLQDFIKGGAAVAATSAFGVGSGFPQAANAVVTEETPRVVTRMGGLLEPFQDGPRSIRMLAPSGWNKFDGEVGAYDLKWQDLVDQTENIKISSTPVKSSTTSIEALGEVQSLGESLANKRNAKLLSAKERLTDGVLFYTFDFAINDGTHQLLQLCVSKGKLWSIDANSKESRWAKRSALYENVLGSFMPKLT